MVLKPDVGADHNLALLAGTVQAGEELVDESLNPALGVRRSLPQPDVRHLTGVRAGRDQRVVAELVGVAAAGALLLIAEHLADERVQIDQQRTIAGPGAGSPRPLECDIEHPVQLADVPEAERPQKRPERRGRHHLMPEHRLRGPGAQQVPTAISSSE